MAALEQARREFENAKDEKQEALRKKVALLEQQFEEAHQRKANAISRAQLTKSGHVYVISNIGSFGEDVFKIGMTRRLDPLERVAELGGSSVPFRFDVHAMIYSEDAPGLETKIHSHLAGRAVNRINSRKEFFRVSLDEIAELVVKACGSGTEFIKTAVAEEFRESEALRRKEEEERNKSKVQLEQDEVQRARQRYEELKMGWKAEPI